LKHLDMALNAWQKITRVLPGKPFGDGKDGDYSSSSIPTMTRQSCSGSANSTTLSLGAAGFANGDVILIHQTRGTGAGQWEINQVSSGGGTTSLTLKVALKYTYTDSGASQAQVVKIPRYKNVTVQSGTWTVPVWNNDVGGILVFAANGLITPTGTISANGSNGGVGTSGGGATGIGHSGGNLLSNSSSSIQAQTGEGTTGDHLNQTSANGTGGGGGYTPDNYRAGGGGGNGTAGSSGGPGGGGAGTHGAGGQTGGNAGLTNMIFGGGGGGAARKNTDRNSGGGASGAGIIVMFGKTISTINKINAVGGIGGSPGTGYSMPGGGSGAGGSVLICSETVNVGVDKIDVRGGVASTADAPGGKGGKGRIAVYYGKSLSGSVSSTYYGTLTTEEDTDLVEAQGVGTYWFM
jgi:hypothetical protein